MRHRQYYIQSLRASGRLAPEVGGDLIVATREENRDIDWELIYRSSQRWHVAQTPHDLEMEGPEGRFEGPAILVRSDGRSHVFRGVGSLSGFHPDDFNDR